METMAYLAEESGIEYEVGTNKKIGSDKPSQAAVANALALAEKEITKRNKKPEEEEEEQIEMELEEPSGGLMSRRNTDGV